MHPGTSMERRGQANGRCNLEQKNENCREEVPSNDEISAMREVSSGWESLTTLSQPAPREARRQELATHKSQATTSSEPCRSASAVAALFWPPRRSISWRPLCPIALERELQGR